MFDSGEIRQERRSREKAQVKDLASGAVQMNDFFFP